MLFRKVLEEKKDGHFKIKARQLLEGITLEKGDGPAPDFFVEKGQHGG